MAKSSLKLESPSRVGNPISIRIEKAKNGFTINFQDKNYNGVTHIAKTLDEAISICKKCMGGKDEKD